MGLSIEQLEGLSAMLIAVSPSENPVGAIRAGFPGIPISRCDAADMRGETPYRHVGEYDVFLVDTSSHCWRIVDDPTTAGGIVISDRHR